MSHYLVLAQANVGFQVATSTLFLTKKAAVDWARRASRAGHPPWNPVHGSRRWAVVKLVQEGPAAWTTKEVARG